MKAFTPLTFMWCRCGDNDTVMPMHRWYTLQQIQWQEELLSNTPLDIILSATSTRMKVQNSKELA
ncbi:hypothetical protein ACO0K2_16600 [Undibacterium sp. MH2W]|uniref:hypothetical protein n=1 Tax=Undibacterium sp. MH2W TaxID=3413044 RepID=UPI003BF0E8F2